MGARRAFSGENDTHADVSLNIVRPPLPCARALLKATTLLVIVIAVQTPPPGWKTVSAITMSIISIIIVSDTYTPAARRYFRRISAIVIGRPTYVILISHQFPLLSRSFSSRKFSNRRTLRVTKFYFIHSFSSVFRAHPYACPVPSFLFRVKTVCRPFFRAIIKISPKLRDIFRCFGVAKDDFRTRKLKRAVLPQITSIENNTGHGKSATRDK